MKTIYFYFTLFVLMSSCATSKTVDNNKIKDIVVKQHFNIASEIAQPSATIGLSKLQNTGILGQGNSASNISLIGNSNFLKIKGDSITSYLPYYGERRMASGYGGRDIAIELEGEIKNYTPVWNSKKQRYDITFQAKSNNELFDVRMTLYPNLKSYITLNSTSRTGITYIGKVNGKIEKD